MLKCDRMELNVNLITCSTLVLLLWMDCDCVIGGVPSLQMSLRQSYSRDGMRRGDTTKTNDVVDGDVKDYVTVNISTGMIRGVRRKVNAGVAMETFLGIPFAAPPTGRNRFARPKPPTPWSGTRDALSFGNQCSGRGLDPEYQADVPYSEDCLYLNVYAPRFTNKPGSHVDSDNGPLPVMFWIHGGGYYGGTGATYNGTLMALRGVVVVTINYRLDIFGFLSTADSVIPGNFGMLDQLLAMDWVRDNIAQFGGNPKDMTIFGESAGGSSVSLHLLSPLSKGKFQKAIMESGTSLCPWATNPSNKTYFAPKQFAQLVGLAVGCSHQESAALLTCLRGVKEISLLNTTIGLQHTMEHGLMWRPVVETTFGFLPDTPINLISQGHILDVPTIRGYNKNEVAIVVKDKDDVGFSLPKLLSLIAGTAYFFFQKHSLLVAAEVEAVYRKNQTDPYGRRSDFERLLTDYYMVAPITYEAQLHARLQKASKSYLYEFSYRPSFDTYPNWMGVIHTDELPFVFGLPKGPDKLSFNTTSPEDLKMADTMVTMWTNFAKTGNPTPQTSDCVINPSSPSIHPTHHSTPSITTTTTDNHNNRKHRHHFRCMVTAKQSHQGIGPLVWQPVNKDPDTVLEINTSLNVGRYARSSAVRLWMHRIPKLQMI